MACNTFKGKCNVCKNLIPITKVGIEKDYLVLKIPNGTYENNQQLCLLITQKLPIPNNILPIRIQIGNNTTSYFLLNKNGNLVYSDQIRTRRVYGVSVKTDSNVLKYNGFYDLPCTRFNFQPLVSE